MPLYDYECGCGETASAFHRMGRIPSTKTCPACGKRTMRRRFGAAAPRTSKTLRTFGQQAEKNAKDLGREGMEYLERSQARERYNDREAKRAKLAAEVGATPIKLPKRFEDNGPEDASLVRQVKKTLRKPSGGA